MLKKILLMILSVAVLVSCNTNATSLGEKIVFDEQNKVVGLWNSEAKIIAHSGPQTEYLVTSTKWLRNGTWDAEQWMYGTWEQAKQINPAQAQKALADCQPQGWTKLLDRNAAWIYGCDPYYSWDNPPPNKNINPAANQPGKQKIPNPELSVLPSIYRHFFSVSSISSATITFWVSGEADVYLDPPVGTRLLRDNGIFPRCHLGTIKTLSGENGTALTIPKLLPGSHCIYIVHKSPTTKPFFGLIFGIEVLKSPSQTSACGWEITEGDCACMVSNETAEYLTHNDTISTLSKNPWQVFGSPTGTEWVHGKWEPIQVIPFEEADYKGWGVDVMGAPWRKLYNKGASWIAHIPSSAGHGWNSMPRDVTNIYRQTFTVTKQCTAELIVYTNDDVDVFIDPHANITNSTQSTKITNIKDPKEQLSNYYYVGKADKQRRGMIVNLQIALTPGTHTIYFVHRNDFSADVNKNTKTKEQRDYYGLLYSLCCKENCPCGDERDMTPQPPTR